MQIILHIGQPKTASTSIQLYCDRNRAHLAAQGVLYPTSLGTKKSFIAPFLNRRGRRKDMFPSREEVLSNIASEFSGNFSKAVLSDETIYNCSEDNKKAIKSLFDKYATSWRILCYLRRPDEHIVSHYQQTIRNFSGVDSSFNEYFNKRMQGSFYRYAALMKRWEDVFGAGTVEARVFHRKTLQGDPIEDFMHWIGVDPGTLPPDDQEPANESLDRAGTEIMRFLALCQAGRPERLRGLDIDEVRAKLRALASSDRLRLDGARARRMQAQFRADHGKLAGRYLPPEHAAVLLAPPADTPPQPPLAPEVLLDRAKAVLGDTDFAREAVTTIQRQAEIEREQVRSDAERAQRPWWKLLWSRVSA